jgi:hypothetical protein
MTICALLINIVERDMISYICICISARMCISHLISVHLLNFCISNDVFAEAAIVTDFLAAFISFKSTNFFALLLSTPR